MTRTIELRIDEVVIHGFNPGDRHAFADILGRRLTSLVEAEPPGWLGEAGPRPPLTSLGAEPVDLPRDATPDAVATALAGTIHRALRSAPPARPAPRSVR